MFITTTDEVCRLSLRVLQNISCLTGDFSWIFEPSVFGKFIAISENGAFSDKVCLSQLIFSAMARGSAGLVRALFESKMASIALEEFASEQCPQSVLNGLCGMERGMDVIMEMGMENYESFDEFCSQCSEILVYVADSAIGRARLMAEAILARHFPDVSLQRVC
jgi:hypothetical protein